MDSTPAACDDGVDHISDLSDDLLHRILSLLPTAPDAARTSALSRRWRDLWTRGPVLRLSDFGTRNLDYDARYNDFVHNVLAQRNYGDASVADTLQVRSLRWPGNSRADVWLRCAMRLAVGSLDFDLRKPWKCTLFMPQHVADKLCPKLGLPASTRAMRMTLRFNYVALLVLRTVDFPALTELTLSGIEFFDDNGDRLCDLLSSSSCCPRLRKLNLSHLSGLKELKLNGEALEMLHLESLSDQLEVLDVNAPQLSTLYAESYFMYPSSNITIRAPALETVDTSLWLGNYQLRIQTCTIQLLQECHPIDRHILSLYVSDTLTEEDQNAMAEIPELPGVIKLTLQYCSDNSHYFGETVIGILARCSNLQYLHLDNLIDVYDSDNPCDDEGCITCDLSLSWKDDVISLEHLQEVDFGGFSGKEYCLDMVQLLLASAPALERMLVTTKASTKGCQPEKMVMESLGSRLPRGKGNWTARVASNVADVEYEWMPNSSIFSIGAGDL